MSNLKNEMNFDIKDKSLSKYLKNRYPKRSSDDFSRSLGELVGELCGSGFKTIGDVHKTLERTEIAAERFETENTPSKLVGSQHTAIGFVIISTALLLGNDFFTFRTVLDNCSPEKLEEYRKLILPETEELQPM